MGALVSSQNEKKDNEVVEKMFSKWIGSIRIPGLGRNVDNKKGILECYFGVNTATFFEIMATGNPLMMCKFLLLFRTYPNPTAYRIEIENLFHFGSFDIIFFPTDPLPLGRNSSKDVLLDRQEQGNEIFLITTNNRPYFSSLTSFVNAAIDGYTGYSQEDVRWEWIMIWMTIAQELVKLFAVKKEASLAIESFNGKEGPMLKIALTVN